MNLRQRLQIRALVNLVLSVIEKILYIFNRYRPSVPKPDISPNPVKPHRPRPLKRVIDTIDNIVPLPWRK